MTQRDVGSAALFKNPTYSEVHDVLVTGKQSSINPYMA